MQCNTCFLSCDGVWFSNVRCIPQLSVGSPLLVEYFRFCGIMSEQFRKKNCMKITYLDISKLNSILVTRLCCENMLFWSKLFGFFPDWAQGKVLYGKLFNCKMQKNDVSFPQISSLFFRVRLVDVVVVCVLEIFGHKSYVRKMSVRFVFYYYFFFFATLSFYQ